MANFERSPQYRAAQVKRSRRSPYRHKPGMQDHGQRYVVSYVDGTGQRRDYGFTDEMDEARTWMAAIKKNPAWDAAKIRERKRAA